MKKKQKKGKEMQLVTDTELMKRFWGDDKKLDKNDKFLRNYILLEGWKDKGKMSQMDKNRQEQIDEEDENREQEIEEYEYAYNLRYEEPAQYLTTHSRHVEGSLRRKDDLRKEQRMS